MRTRLLLAVHSLAGACSRVETRNTGHWAQLSRSTCPGECYNSGEWRRLITQLVTVTPPLPHGSMLHFLPVRRRRARRVKLHSPAGPLVSVILPRRGSGPIRSQTCQRFSGFQAYSASTFRIRYCFRGPGCWISRRRCRSCAKSVRPSSLSPTANLLVSCASRLDVRMDVGLFRRLALRPAFMRQSRCGSHCSAMESAPLVCAA